MEDGRHLVPHCLGRDVPFGLKESVLLDRTRIKRHKVKRASRVAPYTTLELFAAISSMAVLLVPIYTTLSPLLTTTSLISSVLLVLYGRNVVLHYALKALKDHETTHKRRTMPKRIVLIRHGQSMGNVDEGVYTHTPDNLVPLTELGERQAEETGKKLRNLIGDETVRFFVSPYRRSWQTYEHIVQGADLDSRKYTVREEVRVREQDWGNFQDTSLVHKCREERRRFGAFYYRFPHGESGADVYDRVDSFWGSLVREFEFKHCLENFVIVSHGITCRLLLMRYFKWTVADFHKLWNFDNCQMAILELEPDGRYCLITPLKKSD